MLCGSRCWRVNWKREGMQQQESRGDRSPERGLMAGEGQRALEDCGLAWSVDASAGVAPDHVIPCRSSNPAVILPLCSHLL